MAAKFDPYYAWLGIPPEDQPADHYALLGVRKFESNQDVIANLTDQRMAHVKTFQTGPNAADSQKLLNEIAAARVCLLNPEKRASYDAKLRAQIAWRTTPKAQPLAATPEIILPPPAALHAPAPQPDSVSDAFAFIAATVRTAAAGSDAAVSKAVLSRAKQRARARARWLFILAPIFGITAVAVAIMIRNSQDADDDVASAPKSASATLVHAHQTPSPVRASASAGAPSVGELQKKAAGDEAANEPNAFARQEAIIPSKPGETTAIVGNAESKTDAPIKSIADGGPGNSDERIRCRFCRLPRDAIVSRRPSRHLPQVHHP